MQWPGGMSVVVAPVLSHTTTRKGSMSAMRNSHRQPRSSKEKTGDQLFILIRWCLSLVKLNQGAICVQFLQVQTASEIRGHVWMPPVLPSLPCSSLPMLLGSRAISYSLSMIACLFLVFSAILALKDSYSLRFLPTSAVSSVFAWSDSIRQTWTSSDNGRVQALDSLWRLAKNAAMPFWRQPLRAPVSRRGKGRSEESQFFSLVLWSGSKLFSATAFALPKSSCWVCRYHGDSVAIWSTAGPSSKHFKTCLRLAPEVFAIFAPCLATGRMLWLFPAHKLIPSNNCMKTTLLGFWLSVKVNFTQWCSAQKKNVQD